MAGRPEIVIDRHIETDAEGFVSAISGQLLDFKNEAEYQKWLIDNLETLKTVIGLQGDGTVRTNKTYCGTNLRPDIVLKAHDCDYIIEVKSTRARYKSQNMTSQVAAIGQVLLYREVTKNNTKLFIIDNCIHEETVLVVLKNNLDITLIEANERHFAILRSKHGD